LIDGGAFGMFERICRVREMVKLKVLVHLPSGEG